MILFPIRKWLHIPLVWLCLAASFCTAADHPFRVYVGTYTDKDSKGIYSFTFDPATGNTGTVELSVGTQNPSFLAVGRDSRSLYAANEVNNYSGGATGAVSRFATQAGSSGLKLMQQISSAGPGPAHLSLDPTGRYLLVANYNGGNFAVFRIEKNGQLGQRTAFVQNKGSSVNKERQSEPHAHQILSSKDGRWVFVADLGTDELLVYHFDATTGALTPSMAGNFRASPGSGPRHLAISPSGNLVYLVNEMASTINVLSFDSSSGKLNLQQTITTLPTDFKGENTTAEIAVDTAGKTLYVSNRGDDSIAVFSISPSDGKISMLQRMPTGGKEPRHFALDPTGRWLLAENQDSGTINLFAVDAKTGRLTSTSHTVRVSTPVCAVFVPEQ